MNFILISNPKLLSKKKHNKKVCKYSIFPLMKQLFSMMIENTHFLIKLLFNPRNNIKVITV